MAGSGEWAFYGRQTELGQLQEILSRRRWFFLQISGRSRIGKTTLIQQALQAAGVSKTLYIQIPDSDPAGVVAACNGYLETFGLEERVHSLGELARLIANLAESGYVVALDEFQYFHRKPLFDFCSLLQAEVDRLSARAGQVPGGLIVLGSLHAEMTALLDDRQAPLFNRATDTLELGHLDIGSVLEILRAHADEDPERLLFLWNLFEGVPKFYRDAYEQGVLDADRETVLRKLFFSSSSPLRNEADNWFLRELRGRYDMVLQFLASHPGCNNAAIESHLAEVSGPGEARQVGGHLKILSERYRMIERRLPIFARPKARSGRYYIRDNFLRAWLSALQKPVSARPFARWTCSCPVPTNVCARWKAMPWRIWWRSFMRSAVAWVWATLRCPNGFGGTGIARTWRLIWWRCRRTRARFGSAPANGRARSWPGPFRLWWLRRADF